MCLRLLAALVLLALPAGASSFSHGLLDQVLRTYVDAEGRVDYPGLKANRAALDAYADSLGLCSPHSHPERFPSPAQELAYWINAYNAFVLKGVIDGYPVRRVDELGGLDAFFRKRQFRAGGQALTLDQVENQIIRPQFRDPRVHFALNCGAAGCPALLGRAYEGEKLDSLLDAQARRFAADTRQVRFDPQSDTLHLSQILNWYGEDFLRWFPARPDPPDSPTLLDYLLLYLPADQARQLREHRGVAIRFTEYDWALNAQPLK